MPLPVEDVTLLTVGATSSVTVMFAVSVVEENAVVPPLVEVSTLVPTVPLVWSQARKVMALLTVPE